MRIDVDDKWFIESDSVQWNVYRKLPEENKRKGKPTTHHGTFAQAVQSLANRQIRMSDADNLIEAIAETNKITEKFRGLLQFDEQSR